MRIDLAYTQANVISIAAVSVKERASDIEIERAVLRFIANKTGERVFIAKFGACVPGIPLGLECVDPEEVPPSWIMSITGVKIRKAGKPWRALAVNPPF